MNLYQTPRLNLPLIAPGQALKYITHNEALKTLDSLLHLNVQGDLIAPSATAETDTFYRVAAHPDLVWAEHANQIAHYTHDKWTFTLPLSGQVIWNVDLQTLNVWTGAEWSLVSSSAAASLKAQSLGINAAPNAHNKLSIASAASLFSHEGANHQLAINKASETDTASIILQSGYEGIAEIGLAGDNNFHIKVHSDTGDWHEAMIIDPQTAQVTLPSGLSHPETGAALSTLIPTPGGDGEVSIFRNNVSRFPQPRYAELSSAENGILTFTEDLASHFFNSIMEGVSLVQIWNVSKATPESSWVKAVPDASSLTVFDASTIVDWQRGDIIQLGTPSSISTTSAIVIDISPMMENYFGRVFRQTGVILKVGCASAVTEQSKLSISGSLAPGAQVPVSSYPDGEYAVSQLTLPCGDLSPISNSNLIYLTEKTKTGYQLSTSLISVNFLMG